MHNSSTHPAVAAVGGVAQIVQRPGASELMRAHGPIELMVEACHGAAVDAGAPALLNKVGFVGVAGGWFRYQNPAQLVAERIGSPNATTALTAVSGTGPQDLLGLAAERIASGQLDVALIVGGEARWSHQRIKRAGSDPVWLTDPGLGTPEALSAFPDVMVEEAIGLGSPATSYALFEDSLRFSRGRSVSEHRDYIAALWASFSAVGATNVHAWDRNAHSAKDIREPSRENRMISFPYTKAMVANNTVDMASAILVCSVDAARASGMNIDKLVFPHVVTSSHETWRIVERNRLHGCPALTTAGRAAFTHSGLGPDDFEHIDLYACFPAIVQMSSDALGIDSTRPLTVTGGLGFAGAPVGNAVGHSIATMTERVRSSGIGFVHGNGGQATKHSFAVYASKPPKSFARIDVQAHVDHQSRAVQPEDWAGPITVEAATVIYGREGQSLVLAAVLNHAGQRGWGRSTDPQIMTEAEAHGIAGRVGSRSADGRLDL